MCVETFALEENIKLSKVKNKCIIERLKSIDERNQLFRKWIDQPYEETHKQDTNLRKVVTTENRDDKREPNFKVLGDIPSPKEF